MDDKFWEFNNQANVHFGVIHRLGSLLLMSTVTEKKLDEFSDEIPWYNKDDSRSLNKHRMKETGRMLDGYRQNILELSIIGLAKTLEDLIFDFKDVFNLEINFWKDCDIYNYFEEMKIIRELNNCIKHNKGIIQKGSRGGNYLVDTAGFKNNSKISRLEINIETYIMKCFIFQMDLFWGKINKDNPYLSIKDDHKEIRKHLIPEFIEKSKND